MSVSESKPAPPDPWPWFHGDSQRHPLGRLPAPPPWRDTSDAARRDLGVKFQVTGGPKSRTVDVVNAALLLRRPILITGKPGTGKSTLARAVAEELELGEVLVWPITTRTTLQQGLYHYDAIGRLHAVSIRRQKLELRRLLGNDDPVDEDEIKRLTDEEDIGDYIRLGPLGTAFAVSNQGATDPKQPPLRPRVLLIDEIDKSDIDLPNDLLHVLEQGEFEIPELSRIKTPKDKPVFVRTHDRKGRKVPVFEGYVRCEQFPLILMTSNGEREFPPAFFRRCHRLQIEPPTREELTAIVNARLEKAKGRPEVAAEIDEFLSRRDGSEKNKESANLAVDQLLNAVQLLLENVDVKPLRDVLYRSLTGPS